MRTPSRAARAWAGAVLWTALILVLSSDLFAASNSREVASPLLAWLLPWLDERSLWLVHKAIRKSAHFGIYAVLALWVRHALYASGVRRPGALAGLALAWALAVAVADEGGQSLSSARTGSPRDVALDLAGAVAALGAASWWSERRHGRRERGEAVG